MPYLGIGAKNGGLGRVMYHNSYVYSGGWKEFIDNKIVAIGYDPILATYTRLGVSRMASNVIIIALKYLMKFKAFLTNKS